MKAVDINQTGAWRARQTIGTAAESMETTGACLRIAAERKDWAEVRRLLLEMNADCRKLNAVFFERRPGQISPQRTRRPRR